MYLLNMEYEKFNLITKVELIETEMCDIPLTISK